jgi:carbonic anhydrase
MPAFAMVGIGENPRIPARIGGKPAVQTFGGAVSSPAQVQMYATEGDPAMSIIDQALTANATLADGYDPGRGGPPAPKIAIVTCADPRLTGVVELMGLDSADVDLIRNVGTVIDEDSIRSLIVSTRMLGTQEIMIINHNDCGLSRFSGEDLEQRLRNETGEWPIAPVTFYTFTDVEQNTLDQVRKVRSHPWISADIPVRGFIYGVDTGRLREVSATPVGVS